MKQLITLTALAVLGSGSFISADQYYSGCPSGNCQQGGYGYQQDQWQAPSGYYQQRGQRDDYQQRGQRDDYQQKGQRDDYQQRGQRDDYQQRDQRDDYQQRGQRDNYQQQRDQYGNYQQRDQRNYQQRNDQAQNYGDSDNRQGNDQSAAADLALFKKIQQVLSSDNGFSNVFFDVDDGSVTLRGFVEKADHNAKIEKSVKEIDGVKDVDNQITISGAENKSGEANNSKDAAATMQDRQLNAKIRERLGKWMARKNIDALVIKTNNGEVVIIGTVDKPEDIQKTNDELKDVDGIKRLDNQLKVNK